ncbi:MAG: hypothetical protein LBL73_02710 [Synergistaceae bacterium]|nr:hypothetical protein [Synergistaceae bacterium]
MSSVRENVRLSYQKTPAWRSMYAVARRSHRERQGADYRPEFVAWMANAWNVPVITVIGASFFSPVFLTLCAMLII